MSFTGKNLYIICGPSGAGKTTIYKRLLVEHPNLHFSVSVTTRKPRSGEEDGRDYNFVTQEQFKQLLDNNAFAEHALVHGNHYGTLKNEIAEKSYQSKCVLDVDVQGAESLRALYKDAVYIFIAPPSVQALEERLKNRNTESPEAFKLRLKNALKELEEKSNFDYVVVNDNLEDAYLQLKKIIISQ